VKLPAFDYRAPPTLDEALALMATHAGEARPIAGEGGIIPVGGVIATVVAAALAPLDVSPCALPLSPPRVW
jgi:CO/xanthine dehydrogenase FAD-binding subunit